MVSPASLSLSFPFQQLLCFSSPASCSLMASCNQLHVLLICLLVFPFPHAAGNSARCHGKFPALFNFGDSNSDTGGLVAAFGPQPPPNGITFFHKPSGRYCDGRLVIDFIAQELGLPYLNAYLQSVGSDFKAGANFATAGSTILAQNTTLQQSGFSPFYLGVQVRQFKEFKQRSLVYQSQKQFASFLPRPDYFEKALYVFDIGQNDLTSAYFRNLPTKQVKAYIPGVLKEFSSNIQALYQEGARNFLIISTGPLGCLAYVLTRLPYKLSDLDSHGCATPYNRVAEYYNKMLEVTVSKLKSELTNATFVLVDGYQLKYNLFVNARLDGFRFTLRACCGFGGGPYNFNSAVGCGAKPVIGGKQLSYNLCEDPSVYVCWDGVHYTEAANHLIANGLFSGNYSIPKFLPGHFCELYKH